MSTGDQTAYIRSKVAERGTQKPATFMRDGFDSWAESSAPAREGGLEKEAAPYSGSGRSSISKKYIDDSQMVHGGSMHGGAISAQDFVALVPKLFEFYNQVKDWTALVKEDLRSPEVPAKYQATAKTIADTLQSIGLGKPPNVALHDACMKHMPPRTGKVGGAATWQEWMDKTGKQLKAAYNWFLANKPAIHFLLKMKSINPPGYDYAAQLERAMTSVGLGRRMGGAYPELGLFKEEAFTGPAKYIYNSSGTKRSLNPLYGGASCSCSTSGRKVGGMMSADQMAAAARAAMEQVKSKARAAEGVVSPNVRSLVAKAQAAEQKARAKVGGMSMSNAATAARLAYKYGGAYTGMFGETYGETAPVSSSRSAPRRMKADSFDGPASGGPPTAQEARLMEMARQMGGRKPSARGAIVKKVMQEQGLSLPQASKYVKQNGLY
jgi:hypothetical protein